MWLWQAYAGQRYYAMELAEQFIEERHPKIDEERRERLVDTILCAGLHLADCGAPGAWQTFQPGSFLDKMPFEDDEDRLEVCTDMAHLFRWMGTEQLIAPRRAARVLMGLRLAGPEDPAFTTYCEDGIEGLAKRTRTRRRPRRYRRATSGPSGRSSSTPCIPHANRIE